jgi:hypothetical protein
MQNLLHYASKLSVVGACGSEGTVHFNVCFEGRDGSVDFHVCFHGVLGLILSYYCRTVTRVRYCMWVSFLRSLLFTGFSLSSNGNIIHIIRRSAA